MRAGFKECNAITVAKIVQDLGIDALCIHPRLQSDGFSGTIDYSLVFAIKQNMQIPVFVSGGITSWPIAQCVYEKTHADGFLIRQSQIGCPWILH